MTSILPHLAYREVKNESSPSIILNHKDFSGWWLTLEQRTKCAVGLDGEYTTPKTVPTPGGRLWTDMSAIRPLLLGLAARTINREGQIEYHCASVDLLGADSNLLDRLSRFFRQRHLFACHWQRAEYSALSVLGLPRPPVVFDTCLAERYLHLGADPKIEELEEEDDAPTQTRGRYSLLETARRHSITHSLAHRKADLEQRFASWSEGNKFQMEDHRYVVEDARVSAELYWAQSHAMLENGTLHRFLTVESPAASMLTEMT